MTFDDVSADKPGQTKTGFTSSSFTSSVQKTSTGTTQQTIHTFQESSETKTTHSSEVLAQKINLMESELENAQEMFDAVKKRSSHDKSEHEYSTSEGICDIGSAVVAPIRMEIKSIVKTEEYYEKPRVVSAVSKETKNDFQTSELVSDLASTLVASTGIDFKPEKIHGNEQDYPDLVKTEHEHPISELLTDSTATMLSSAGIAIQPERKLFEGHKQDIFLKHEPPFSEMTTESTPTPAASAEIDCKLKQKHDKIQDQPDLVKTDPERLIQKHGHPISELLADSTTTLAASAGIAFKPEDIHGVVQDQSDLVRTSSVESLLIHEHPISELLADSTATLAASAGIDFKPETKTEKEDDEDFSIEVTKHKHVVTELFSDAAMTLAASIGIAYKPDDDMLSRAEEAIAKMHSSLESNDKRELSETHEHRVTELATDVTSALEKSIGIDLQSETTKIETFSKSHVTDIVSDVSSTLAGSIGIPLKSEDKDHASLKSADSKESVNRRDFVVSELAADDATTMLETIGVDMKFDDDAEDEDIDLHGSLAESITETGAFVAASIGIMLPLEKVSKSVSKESLSKVEESGTVLKQDEKTIKEVLTDEEHLVRGDNKSLEEVSATELVERVVKAAEEKVSEIMEIIREQEQNAQEEKIAVETESQLAGKNPDNIEKATSKDDDGGYDDERSPDFSPEISEDRDKILSEMKDLNRADRRCSDFLEGISQPGGSLIRIDTSHVTHGKSSNRLIL